MGKQIDNWNYKYKLAKAYYEYYGNLEVPFRFKTKNGYEKANDGIALGVWINNQRQAYRENGTGRITKEQIKLLTNIGMRFENKYIDDEWKYKYNLAKAYYEYHGNLEIPSNFKTKNGYEKDKDGIALGAWINTQRQAYKGKGTITTEQVELLNQIGMRFETKCNDDEWNHKYNLAKAYYEHYGNLEVPFRFKTKNGYEYDNDGIALGTWINTQRQVYKGKGTITTEQVELLNQIGMRFETKCNDDEWNRKYNLAKAYYEHYGNLEVPFRFKTKNGYEKANDGIVLGAWINNQRQAYKEKGTGRITKEQIKLLTNIGMRFENKCNDDEWNHKYNLAKAYYEHHGNLEIPSNFKTKNGYEYDKDGIALGVWINNQRQAYKGKGTSRIKTKHIELLDKIGLIWMRETIDKKQQVEIISEKNNIRKQIEILNRVKSYLNAYQGDSLPSKEKINEGFIEKLNVYIKK